MPDNIFRARQSYLGNNSIDETSAYGWHCAIKDGTQEAIVTGWGADNDVATVWTVDGGVTWYPAEEPIMDSAGSQPGYAIWSSVFDRYYIVGFTDWEGNVLISSTDGNIWARETGNDDYPTHIRDFWNVLVDAPSLGKMLLVGGDQRISGTKTWGSGLTSDGSTFTFYNNALTGGTGGQPYVETADWSESLGKFVAGMIYKARGSINFLYYSSDGQTWTAANTTGILTTAHFYNCSDIRWMPLNECFIACVSHSDPPFDNLVLKSTNGITWTNITPTGFESGEKSVELADGAIMNLVGSVGYPNYVAGLTYDQGGTWTTIPCSPTVQDVNQIDSDPVFDEVLISGYMYDYPINGGPTHVIATANNISPISVSFDDVIFPK